MILFFIIIIILLVFALKTYNNNSCVEEYFSNDNIYFLNKSELNNLLIDDLDNYFKKFYHIDFISRNVQDINEYTEKIKKSILDKNEIKDEIITRIRKCIQIIDSKTNNIKVPWIDIKKLNEIQWKIGITKGKSYENGLPHTRKDCILLSTYFLDNFGDNKLIEILLHEKIHLYQKKYEEDLQLYLNLNGYEKYKKREENDKTRANPDIDEWIYLDKNKNVNKAVYNRNNPFTLQDVTFYPEDSQSNEHPYEKMAIDISKMI